MKLKPLIIGKDSLFLAAALIKEASLSLSNLINSRKIIIINN